MHLLDPAIVIPSIESQADQSSFWVRFAEWERDPRVALGIATYEALSTLYAVGICGEPTTYIPPGMSSSVHRAVRGLLVRRPFDEARNLSSVALDPPYRGAGSHSQLLSADLAQAQYPQTLAMGSIPESWDSGTVLATIDAPPPEKIHIHFAPNTPTAEEVVARRSAKLAGLRVLVVGGKVDPAIVGLMESRFGLARDRIRWEACEKNKPPRNIDNQISGLRGANAIVVCITGKMSHATWHKSKAACAGNDVRLVAVETAAEMLVQLESIADQI